MKYKCIVTIFTAALLDTMLAFSQIDATFLLTNPGFDYQDFGWTFSNIKRKAFWFPEHYPRFTSSNCAFMSSASDIFQSFDNVPNGDYAVSCKGFYRNGTAEEAFELTRLGKNIITALLYANNDSTRLVDFVKGASDVSLCSESEAVMYNAKYIPCHAKTAKIYFDKGLYNNNVSTTVKNGKLKVGIRVTSCPAGGWYVYDNFRIIYKGGDISTLANCARKKTYIYRTHLHSLDSIVNKQKDELKKDIEYRFYNIDSTKTIYSKYEYRQCHDSIQVRKADIGKMLDSLKSGITNCLTLTSEMECETPDTEIIRIANYVNDFIFSTYGKIPDISIKLAIAKAMTDDYMAGGAPKTFRADLASMDNPIDVTDIYLRNPRFYNTTLFWKDKNIIKPESDPFVYFSWNNKGDIYQTIYNVPNGIYTVSCQGYYRDGHTMDTYYGYKKGKNKIYAMLYANNDETTFCDIMSATQLKPCCSTDEESIGGTYTPFGYESAIAYFNLGLYPNIVTTIVTDGKLRIGVRSDYWVADCICAFSNFKILYKGKKNRKRP